jgi:acyl-CoA hydrolase
MKRFIVSPLILEIAHDSTHFYVHLPVPVANAVTIAARATSTMHASITIVYLAAVGNTAQGQAVAPPVDCQNYNDQCRGMIDMK